MNPDRAIDLTPSCLCFRKKKRKSRWTDETCKTFIPGLPTMIPTGMSKEQEEAYLCKWTLFICKFSFPSFRPEDFRLVYTFSYQVCVSPMIIYQIAAFLTFGQYAHNPFFTVQLKIEEASRRLRSGDLGIALNPEDRFDQLLLLSTF